MASEAAGAKYSKLKGENLTIHTRQPSRQAHRPHCAPAPARIEDGNWPSKRATPGVVRGYGWTVSSLLLPVGLQLAALLVRIASVTKDPSLGAAAAVLGDGTSLLDRLRQMSSGDDRQRLGKRLAEELERRLEQRRTEENRRELRGAATEVQILLANIGLDDVFLAAVRNPGTFPEYLHKRATDRRQNVAQAAEPAFDALVQVAGEEFMRIAANSPVNDPNKTKFIAFHRIRQGGVVAWKQRSWLVGV